MDDITFVTCVEPGLLESRVIRLAESLRQFGGEFAQSNLIAVTPRFAMPLSRSTQREFVRLRIQHERLSSSSPYNWYNFLGKPIACSHAARISSSSTIAWLDGDTLLCGPPVELLTGTSNEVVAMPNTAQDVSSSGPVHANEAYCAFCANVAGISVDDLPWFEAAHAGVTQRCYLQAGVFSFSRESGFAERYLQQTVALLDARVSHRERDIFFLEQMALGLSVISGHYDLRLLSSTHNLALTTHLPNCLHDHEALTGARILHYHDMLDVGVFPVFCETLDQSQPKFSQWVKRCGPLKSPADLRYRWLNKMLGKTRRWRQKRHLRSCVVL